MIAISAENGPILKVLPWENGKLLGFHPQFGFVSQDTYQDRAQNRERHGFKVTNPGFLFQFRLGGSSEAQFALDQGENCQVLSDASGWLLKGAKRNFHVQLLNPAAPLPIASEPEEKDRTWILSFLVVLLIPIGLFVLSRLQSPVEQAKIVEQVMVQVKVKPEVQKPVSVLDRLPTTTKQAQVAKRAVQQDLGFLGLIGRKDLSKAIGGAPTALKDVSPGAGPGGKQGSGGELLVGLGEGLKRVTVGNTGVAGLGGIGTRGAGGGAGGYGNTAIGSGEGKALSSVPLSQDIVLDGGLDRSVVQATIAKYINQVRACYEQGLKRNPALGGIVTMAFEVGASGDLNSAHPSKSSLGDAEVEKCISDRMMAWKFPKPRGGVTVKATYPFVLRSANG